MGHHAMRVKGLHINQPPQHLHLIFRSFFDSPSRGEALLRMLAKRKYSDYALSSVMDGMFLQPLQGHLILTLTRPTLTTVWTRLTN